MKCAWTSAQTSVNTYCKLFSKCSFKGLITELLDHFVISVHKMIFEKDQSCMLEAAMEALTNIVDWYASSSSTFIEMYNVKRPPHVLTKFSMDKLVMDEVSYHISGGLSTRLHHKKKAPSTTIPLRIGLYEIHNLKKTDAEIGEIVKYPFNTRSFNSYDPHCLVKDHCKRVQFLWIHVVCHYIRKTHGDIFMVSLGKMNRSSSLWHG